MSQQVSRMPTSSAPSLRSLMTSNSSPSRTKVGTQPSTSRQELAGGTRPSASSKFDRIVDQSNWEGNTALHEAVKNGDYELTDLLLRQGSLSVNKMNKEEKCPLYLAVETGNLEILSRLLEAVDENEDLSSQIEGISPAHGAVVHRRIDMLIEMSERRKGLFNLRLFGAPLHLAASENYVDGVELLVDKFNMSSFEPNEQGYLPIHVACKMGHLETIKVLRQHWQDWLEPNELLIYDEEQNILHVAAKYGRASVVKYILGDPKLEKLINAKDKYGNTPLHVATEQWQPNVMLSLTRDNRVNLGLVNHNNSTALDIVDKQLQQIEGPFHQRRSDSWMEPPDIHKLNRHAEVRMVVATLIAGVTFAAGFSVPGGYNSSGPEAGIATLLNKPVYDVFMICNSIAMYNSIITVVFLLWTQINDSHAVFRALGMTRLPLLIALATMSMAFLAGIYVTTSKHTWVVIVTLVVGITALFVILILYIALYVPLGYNYRLVQFFADYIIRAAILISRRVSVIEEASEGCSCGPAVAYGRPPSWRGSVTIGTSWCPPGPNAIMLPPL
ncbi:protein ACCELERATED CELL DEATH 6-like [Eucalyptus grandis]|uniref:protein ACCELERATED CELL DEATH 6-like n=1 Tax=Eucalyptus grandis TaxID=71139 RepID=UPI00192EADC1|nr:protein ACCELERATED CELL DEATH 6-like [Eucalyptus grandis]